MKQRLILGELLKQMQGALQEELTFGQLFQLTDPGRLARAKNYVRGPPLDIFADNKRAYHIFNFKSYPSTTGLRHRGYVAFKKPRNNRPQASENLPVEVDCDCPDYRYRWAWANKQHGAGKVGPQSMNKAHNRAPVITNPSGKPSLCKHIAATVNYIQGLIQRFPTGEEPDTDVDVSWKIDKLVAWAQKRHDNYDAERQKARERERIYRDAQAARNVAGPMAAADVPQGIENEIPVPLPGEEPIPEQPQPPQPEEPEEGEERTRNESRVVKPNSKTMNTDLTKTRAIVEAMADDLDIDLEEPGDIDHPAVPPPPEEGEEMDLDSELPPVDAEEPEDEALQLLRSIATGIDRLAAELAPIEGELEELEGEELENEGEELEKEGEELEKEGEIPPVEDDDEFTDAMPVSTGA